MDAKATTILLASLSIGASTTRPGDQPHLGGDRQGVHRAAAGLELVGVEQRDDRCPRSRPMTTGAAPPTADRRIGLVVRGVGVERDAEAVRHHVHAACQHGAVRDVAQRVRRPGGRPPSTTARHAGCGRRRDPDESAEAQSSLTPATVSAPPLHRRVGPSAASGTTATTPGRAHRRDDAAAPRAPRSGPSSCCGQWRRRAGASGAADRARPRTGWRCDEHFLAFLTEAWDEWVADTDHRPTPSSTTWPGRPAKFTSANPRHRRQLSISPSTPARRSWRHRRGGVRPPPTWPSPAPTCSSPAITTPSLPLTAGHRAGRTVRRLLREQRRCSRQSRETVDGPGGGRERRLPPPRQRDPGRLLAPRRRVRHQPPR